jgi:hypothetical protein
MGSILIPFGEIEPQTTEPINKKSIENILGISKIKQEFEMLNHFI